MAHYIDAEKLIHDLEERIYAYSEGYADGDNCRKDAIETLLKDVKYQCSLQQEQPEVDLEKELEEEIERFYRTDEYRIADTLGRGFETLARHFAEWGRKHLKK